MLSSIRVCKKGRAMDSPVFTMWEENVRYYHAYSTSCIVVLDSSVFGCVGMVS